MSKWLHPPRGYSNAKQNACPSHALVMVLMCMGCQGATWEAGRHFLQALGMKPLRMQALRMKPLRRLWTDTVPLAAQR